ncbi:hypothetical protein DIPPA_12838 [Diplonema papillatum]|nr:hypothetical protein DIPPA_12838 [Diplonema papillatum]
MEALQAQGKQQTALLSRLVDKIDEKNDRQAVAADPREGRALCDSDDDSEGTDKASSERTGTPFGFLPRGMASLDPEKWYALDDPGREFATLNVRDHYKDLTAAQRGSGLAPQAREARNRLDDLELIIRSLGRCSSLEDAEEVLQKLAERAVGRLQVLQRGVVQGDWESAEVLERALTVDDEAPQTGWRQQEGRGESPLVVKWAPLAYTALRCPDPPATGLKESGGPPKGRPRMVEKPLSKREVRQVRLDVEKHLSRALASSTWRGVESTHRRMLEFRGEWEAATGEKLSKAEATILWVSRKLRGSKEIPGISMSTALQYVQNVKSAEKRVGVPLDSQALRDFERSLKRQGALRPQKQALALAWRGAARVADVTGLKAGDVTRQKDFLAINWSDTKSDPFKLGVTTGIVLPEHLDSILEKKLRRKAPQDRLLATSYRRMSAALKRVRKGLTGHSLRRGAAASLLDAGLSLEEIRRVTRHSSIEALVSLCYPVDPPATIDPPAIPSILRPPPPRRPKFPDFPLCYDPPSFDSDDAPDVDFPYSGSLCVRVAGGKVGPPSERQEGSLARISCSRVDVDALRSLDTRGLLHGVIDTIVSEDAFKAALRPGALECLESERGLSRGISRGMLGHLDQLREFGVMDTSPSRQSVVLPAFTVPKKSGGLRLVCDGRKLNALMQKPPAMFLPDVRDVIARFLQASYVVEADAVSYFYQFPLGAAIRKYFGANLAARRGAYTRCTLEVMCMGWNWAPCIAQRSSLVLLPEEDGVCWVDNFFAVGASKQEATGRFAALLERCEVARVELNTADETFGVPMQRFEALGLEFDLAADPPRFRSSPSWVLKLLEADDLRAVLSGGTTPRTFFKVFGSFVWFCFTTGRPLCYMRSALSFVRRLASQVGSGERGWDSPLDVPFSTVEDVRRALASLRTNEWCARSPDLQSVIGWSDASDAEWAVLLETTPRRVIQDVFLPPREHIFIKELLAALQAVWLAADEMPGKKFRLMVDNQAVVFALRKGHSKNYLANEILCLLFDLVAAGSLQLEPRFQGHLRS